MKHVLRCLSSEATSSVRQELRGDALSLPGRVKQTPVFGSQAFLELLADLSQLRLSLRTEELFGVAGITAVEPRIITRGFLVEQPMRMQMTQPVNGWEVQIWSHSQGVRTTDSWGCSTSCQRERTESHTCRQGACRAKCPATTTAFYATAPATSQEHEQSSV